MIRVITIRRVPVYVHWSVPAVCACRSEAPEHGPDGAFVAAAGPVAQFVVAIPIIVLVYTFGYPPFAWLAVFVAVIGFASPFVTAFNLLPIRPLDGSRAWQLLRVRRRPRPREETALEAFERARREAIRRT